MTPHQELYTATINTCHTITALPHDDDDDGDETAAAREGETKGETKSTELVQQPRGRRQSISISLATDYSIVSIAAVSNIVNMILAPMVIVPFLDYITLGKIPRSNTAKPGTSDGAFAKMGTLKSISQPLTNGWTVIFVSVSSDAPLRSLPRTSLRPTALDSANDEPIIISRATHDMMITAMQKSFVAVCTNLLCPCIPSCNVLAASLLLPVSEALDRRRTT